VLFRIRISFQVLSVAQCNGVDVVRTAVGVKVAKNAEITQPEELTPQLLEDAASVEPEPQPEAAAVSRVSKAAPKGGRRLPPRKRK
jgi:hypothetical protein